MDAQQFVYTNVEEGDSPHRRRGYQAWLFPAHFTDVQRRAVEGHLNQFDPDPRDGAAERYLSTPLFDGFHLIARSISLSEKDRFNRSGRFHAHGLILSVEDFKTLGYDPFRVIDANPFQNDPAEVIGRADWAAIMKAAAAALPPLKLELAEARPAGEASPEVVGWLVNNALRPAAVSPVRFLAVPRPPAEVLDFARRVIHALPPRFRKVVSFDTLRPLRHPHTAHLSGAVSPERLRGWTTTQKYAVVEPGKPLALTQPPSPWQELATEWATNPTLGRKDREHSCLLTDWLGGVSERLPFDPAKVSAVAVELVRRRLSQRERMGRESHGGRRAGTRRMARPAVRVPSHPSDGIHRLLVRRGVEAAARGPHRRIHRAWPRGLLRGTPDRAAEKGGNQRLAPVGKKAA